MVNREKGPFYSKELARSRNEKNREELERAAEFLTAIEDAEGLIESGNITFAMIRPQVGPDANLLHIADTEAAETIEEMINGLGVMAKFSFVFDPTSIAKLYEGGPRESMEDQVPLDPESYPSRWPEFIDFMTSAPTTALILFSEEGDAIEKWRAHLGHWNVDANRDPSTIRGRLAVNKYNNLVHGSDSPQAVRREIGIIKGALTA
jgi:nucleoside diphosphate kinase